MKTALIAEDNLVNRELLRELLEMRGYAVVEASDGEETINQIGQAKPDILLLDLNMPVLDGFGTVKRIRQDARFASMLIVAVTAYAMRGDREKILNSGFDGYLSKPISSAELERELERVLKTNPQ